MRIWVLSVVVLLVGVLLGLSATSYELVSIDERFEIQVRAIPDIAARASDGTAVAVVVGERTHTFEMIPKGGEGTHTFVIRNEGNGALELQRHTVSCGLCVHTEFERGVVQPREEIAIEVELRARKPGQILSESLELRTNDPKQKHITLNLSAFVSEAARASVEGLTLDNISTGDEQSLRFEVLGYYSDKMRIIEHELTISNKREFFNLEFRELTPDEFEDQHRARAGYEVLVHVKKGLPVGPVRQNVRMVALCGENEEIEIEVPILGVVRGDLTFFGPDYITTRNTFVLGRTTRGKALSRTMFIRVTGPHREDVELTIDSIDPQGSLLATLAEPKGTSSGLRIYPLTISVDQDSQPINRFDTAQTKPGVVTIKTTHPTISKLRLNVHFAIE
jgi:hypothetical protein